MITWKVDKSLLYQPFANDVEEVLMADPADWYVTYGFRTRDEQAALYQKYLNGGPLAAPPGRSAHEYGLAVDVTLVHYAEDCWDVNDPDWTRLLQKIHLHPRLHSLEEFGDFDHIEAVNWRIINGQRTAQP